MFYAPTGNSINSQHELKAAVNNFLNSIRSNGYFKIHTQPLGNERGRTSMYFTGLYPATQYNSNFISIAHRSKPTANTYTYPHTRDNNTSTSTHRPQHNINPPFPPKFTPINPNPSPKGLRSTAKSNDNSNSSGGGGSSGGSSGSSSGDSSGGSSGGSSSSSSGGSSGGSSSSLAPLKKSGAIP